MLCNEKDLINERLEKCKSPVWTNAQKLCEKHYKSYYFTSWERLKQMMPCARCFQLGLFRFEDGSREIIKRTFKAGKAHGLDEWFNSQSLEKQNEITKICPDCFDSFWVLHRREVI